MCIYVYTYTYIHRDVLWCSVQVSNNQVLGILGSGSCVLIDLTKFLVNRYLDPRGITFKSARSVK